MSDIFRSEDRRQQRDAALVDELTRLPSEEAWAEFKVGNADPDRIGRLISGLANSARLYDRPFGYLVWGIEDISHRVVGTSFEPGKRKRGNEPLEIWLARSLDPSPEFIFKAVPHPGGRVVLLEIPAASTAPVHFSGRSYIRVGEVTSALSDFPERERALWRKLQPIMWETGVAKSFLSADEVLSLLDYSTYFKLLDHPLPEKKAGIFRCLQEDNIVRQDVGGKWQISNLGAILFAASLEHFERLGRKRVRIIQYQGKTRASSAREHTVHKGYASGFIELVNTVQQLLPINEHIERALRREMPLYPENAIRELVANALVHQDLTITGAGPTIEIYEDRIEITNPGVSLVDVTKFIGAPPRSRNEALAALMRRMKMCEERGSGIIKVLSAAEIFQLPAPDFRTSQGNFQAALFSPRKFKDMDASERQRACYQHAALKYIAGDKMTNATLRERLGIGHQNAAQVSRIIKEALRARLIKAADAASPRAGYVPFLA